MTQQVRIIQMKRVLLKDSYSEIYLVSKKNQRAINHDELMIQNNKVIIIFKRIITINYSRAMNDSQYMNNH